MHSLTLALKFLRQTARQRSFRMLLVSLVLATATISCIGLFQLALNSALLSGSSELLAADRQLTSSKPVNPDWLARSGDYDLEMAEGLNFRSMLSHADEMQLVAVKAVSANYPLRGVVEWKAEKGADVVQSKSAPAPGEIWVNERLLALLDVALGGQLSLGTLSLKVTKILVKEPDMQVGFASLAPRVLISVDDARASGLLLPGSRLDYVYYFAGEEVDLQRYAEALRSDLLPGQQFQGVREGRPRVASSLEKAEQYLALGGALALVLTIIAILVAGREFSYAQFDQVGLLKALGCSHSKIRLIYFWMLALVSCTGWILGAFAGGFIFSSGVSLLSGFAALPGISGLAVTSVMKLGALSLIATLVCAFAFIVPMLGHFKQLSPMIVLRESAHQVSLSLPVMLVTAVGLMGLLALYVGNVRLVSGLVAGLGALLMLTAGLVAIVLRGLNRVSKLGWFTRHPGYVIKLGLHRLARHGKQVSAQVFSLAAAVMVLVILLMVRTSLVSEWQNSLPEDAPNHFLINISPDEEAPLQQLLSESNVAMTAIYPMIRGRLVTINAQPVKQVVSKEQEIGALNRELNLTWSAAIPETNKVVVGQWWDETVGQSGSAIAPAEVSIESQLAGKLGVGVGDTLGFLIGDRPMEARVTNVRSVEWDSMKPNFYMVFNPGSLDPFPATSITSFHLTAGQKGVLNRIQSAFPTISILEVDQFIERIRSIIQQVTGAIELLLLLVGTGAVLVVVAIVNTSIQVRMKEGAMVRALGGTTRLLRGGQLTEYVVIGVLAAAWGILCAELAVATLMSLVFDMKVTLHLGLWPTVIAGTTALVCLVTLLQLNTVTRVPPKQVLQWES